VFVLPNQYSKKYDDSTKMFAFLNAPINIKDDSASATTVNLYAYQQYKPSPKKNANGTTTSSSNKKKPVKQPEKQKLKMATSAKGGPQDLLAPLSFAFTTKIPFFDSTKITLSDTNYHAIKGYHFTQDTSLEQFDLHYAWQENAWYKVIVAEDAFKDSLGNTTGKTDTITFKTKKESEYGSIRLHFNNLQLSKHPVVLMVQQDKITDAVPLKTNEWYQQLFTPGDYEVRLLFDDNQNGVWDAGNYSTKKQPEIVIVFPRKLTIKANYDNEVDFNQ
jgi:hypothetical protein